jgi:hypothetical protein
MNIFQKKKTEKKESHPFKCRDAKKQGRGGASRLYTLAFLSARNFVYLMVGILADHIQIALQMQKVFSSSLPLSLKRGRGLGSECFLFSSP